MSPANGRLMWSVRRHKLAMAGGVILIIFCLVAIFAEFVAPYDPEAYFARYKLAPPTPIRIIDTEGQPAPPFIYQRDRVRNEETLRYYYIDDIHDPSSRQVLRRELPTSSGDSSKPTCTFSALRRPGRGKACSWLVRTGWGACSHDFAMARGSPFDRSHWRFVEPVPGDHLGWDLRILWRTDRHDHPAGDRVHAHDSEHSIVDGVECRFCPQTGRWSTLLWHHHHSLTYRVDRDGAGSSRAFPGAPQWGLCPGGAALRLQ